MPKSFKLAISCGGTGGHFFPGLALARELENSGGEALLLLSGVNAQRQAETAENYKIASVVLPKMPSPQKAPMKFIAGLISGTRKCYAALDVFDPDAVLLMGSFAGLPAFLAAKIGDRPLFLHDGNARIGRANRMMSRFARFMGCAFPPVNGAAIKCPHRVVGMPLRQELSGALALDRQEAMARLNAKYAANLSAEKKTLLVIGGSQGAVLFNEKVPEAIGLLGDDDLQIIHLAGKNNGAKVAGKYPLSALCLDESPDMGWIYRASDLAIARAGGSTVSELALFGLGAILTPYLYASEHHQDDNADFLVASGGAIKLGQSDFTAEKVAEILQNKDIYRMGGKAQASSYPNAAMDMLDFIEKNIFWEKSGEEENGEEGN